MEVERRAFVIPHAIVITGDHAEVILARRQASIKGFTARARILPVGIDPLQSVTKANARWDGEAQRRVGDLRFVDCGGNSRFALGLYSLPSPSSDRIETGGGTVFREASAGSSHATPFVAVNHNRPSVPSTSLDREDGSRDDPARPSAEV